MNLYDEDFFETLVVKTSESYHIPQDAVKKDFFITSLLRNLQESEFAEYCAFKGGTSLSKCYPDSIKRFSEDIDLTFMADEEDGDKDINKKLKKLEAEIIKQNSYKIIPESRSNRNKASYVYSPFGVSVKLEIGSKVRPEPISKKSFKSYIHEYLENSNQQMVSNYDLKEVSILVLDITRTFTDKLFSIKRHAYKGDLAEKARHIYDVVKLFELNEIKDFLNNKEEFKQIVKLTKESDKYYLNNKNEHIKYNPCDSYDFEKWKDKLCGEIRVVYENLHKQLLYTDEKQDFDYAIVIMEEIGRIFKEIGE